jgi:competence protein ComEC
MRVNFKEIFLVFVIFIFIFLLLFLLTLKPNQYTSLKFLNVGQGDSILIETPRHLKILIDGGPDKKVLEEVGKSLNYFENKIDIVIATHDDKDHIMGLTDILKKYQVTTFVTSLPNSESEIMKELLETAKSKNINIIKIDSPKIIKSDDGLIVNVLFPVKNMEGIDDGNDASVVTQIVFGETKFLLTGDLPTTGEKFLIDTYSGSLKSDILKLGHHGSDTSTSPEFLSNVSPGVAVISAGANNSFGHPHQSVINLLNKFKIKYLETKDGAIEFRSDGTNIWRE